MSRRTFHLNKKFQNKNYRDTYIESHTRNFLSHQIRELRGDLSQTEFGRIIGMSQTVVSRLENPLYSGWTLRTLFEIASCLNLAVVVRFVDIPTFLKFTDDKSETASKPVSYKDTKR